MLARSDVTCLVLLVFLLCFGCSGPALTADPPLATSAGAAGAATAGSSGAPSYGAGGAGGAALVTMGGGGSTNGGASAGESSGGQAASAGSVGSAGSAGSASTIIVGTMPPVTDPPPAGWTPVWADEFNAADGAGVDGSKWHHDTGGDGYGNQELEYYTDDLLNAQQRAGNLVITATTSGASGLSCWYGDCKYTSARLLTSGKFSASYGRIEARIKVPAGKGIWPAFWMLGDNIGSARWPTCGEIDIMEAIGSDPATLHGSLHGPGYSGGSPLTGTTKLPNGAKLSDDFHTYAVEWTPTSVKFFLDTTLYETRTPADVPQGSKWVYDHPFFIILNVAVGGQWPGSPDGTTPLPAQMLVDYVRVYKAN